MKSYIIIEDERGAATGCKLCGWLAPGLAQVCPRCGLDHETFPSLVRYARISRILFFTCLVTGFVMWGIAMMTAQHGHWVAWLDAGSALINFHAAWMSWRTWRRLRVLMRIR